MKNFLRKLMGEIKNYKEFHIVACIGLGATKATMNFNNSPSAEKIGLRPNFFRRTGYKSKRVAGGLRKNRNTKDMHNLTDYSHFIKTLLYCK